MKQIVTYKVDEYTNRWDSRKNNNNNDDNEINLQKGSSIGQSSFGSSHHLN